MWVFTKHGFFSAVCARQGDGKQGQPIDPDRIMVRARVRGHLEALKKRFPDLLGRCEIQEFARTDYAFRIFVGKRVWSQVLSGLAEETDYDNFKSEVARHQGRAGADYELSLHEVWSVMDGLQSRAEHNSQFSQPLKLLERRVDRLRLVTSTTMRDSVADYYKRVRSNPGVWSMKKYPTGSEKELYAKFAHILLSRPNETIPALLELFDTKPAKKLRSRVLKGTWHAYRVSTVRRDSGSRGKEVKGPLIFPGGAGQGGIADVVLLLNPIFGADSEQIQADLLLYFELKSRDHYRHDRSQLKAHLDAISSDRLAKNAFLACIGGKPVVIEHPQWLGHATLERFFDMSRVAAVKLGNGQLAREIEDSCKVC